MTALDQPAKGSYLRVTFNWDSSNTNQFARYTNLSTALSGGFAATPLMAVRVPENTGTFEKKDCQIELPLDAFTTRITNGRPHAPIRVVVEEFTTPANDPVPQSNLLTLFRGRVWTARRNPGGRTGMVRILVRSPKARLQVPVGVPVMHHCPFDTYGPVSGLSRASFISIRRIDSISGNSVVIDADPSKPAGWFKNGYMEFEGLSIKIREWDGTTGFTLIERPPDDWLLEFVNIYAGSNKTIEDVRDKLSNEAFFGGIGYKIPAYNPTFEDVPEGEC